MCVFVITLSSLFFIMAAYSTRSPYAEVGAARETLQVMSLRAHGAAHGRGLLPGRRHLRRGRACSTSTRPIICTIWLVFSGRALHPHHQAAQVALRPVHVASRPPGDRARHDHRDERPYARPWWRSCTGARTCCSSVGSACSSSGANPVGHSGRRRRRAGLVYFLEIWIDNNFARVKWQFMLKSAVARGPCRRRREHRVPRVSVRR